MIKKSIYCCFLFLALSLNAQMQVGASLGVPVFDMAKNSKFTMNIEANYLFSSANFEYGPSLSAQYFVNKTGGNAVLYLPVAFAARFQYSRELYFGADVGYGIGLAPKNTESGMYYRPLVGYYLSRTIQVTTSVAVISLINSYIVQGNVGILFAL